MNESLNQSINQSIKEQMNEWMCVCVWGGGYIGVQETGDVFALDKQNNECEIGSNQTKR
jgi:hypothetical protein